LRGRGRLVVDFLGELVGPDEQPLAARG